MKYVVIIVALSFLFIPIQAFSQEMRFYENSRYDFLFEVPTDWQYQEEVSLGNSSYLVVLYPIEFDMDTLDPDSMGLLDRGMPIPGLEFQIESPLISVYVESVSKSKVPDLNEIELNEYVLEKIRVQNPNVKIIDTDVQIKSWGWKVNVIYNSEFNQGFDKVMPYLAHETVFFWEDRESYTVTYRSHENYYDQYSPVFDHVNNTMVIKGVAVPEFQELALTVLVSSIIIIIVITRKFNFSTLSLSKNNFSVKK